MQKSSPRIPELFVNTIDECTRLIDEKLVIPNDRISALSGPLPSLLDQCQALSRIPNDESEFIRTIHHFACTGGTLISKCLASLPNLQLLGELQPHSHLVSTEDNLFLPTDLIYLLRRSSRGTNSELISKVFLSGLSEIAKECRQKGIALVLRDHAHSKYCMKDDVLNVPSLYQLVSGNFNTLSVTTVRHPLDSFLSLTRNKWRHFSPFSLQEYSRRYLDFLDDHAMLKIVKYEEFVRTPQRVLEEFCDLLKLSFNPDALSLFGVHKLSGDSGRSSDIIEERPRLPIPDVTSAEIQSRPSHYLKLCEILEYDPAEK